MHLREFKAGNLYYRDFGNSPLIVELTPSMLSNINEFKDLYKPIPLTPELAEKFGFKYFKSRTKKNTRTWYLNHFFIYFGKQKGPKVNNNYLIPYVHNLQDLYWERFKKELTFKY